MYNNKEIERMKKFGRILDRVTLVLGIFIQVMCGLAGFFLLLAVFGVSALTSDPFKLEISWFNQPIDVTSLSPAMQKGALVLMVVIFVLAVFVIADLMKAFRGIFHAMADGRPFEESAVKGFRRAAFWMLLTGILGGELGVLFMAAVFWVLSYVFSYGLLLQQESDETL